MKIITLEHVSKRYRAAVRLTVREELARLAWSLVPGVNGAARATGDDFLALRDVSLEVEEGETIGFIGPNGSGKSTLLKLLAHITYATSGRVCVLGSVASLIEVGAGFHPELSGRENVYLYGSIMGMRRADVRAKFDRIVDFAELHEVIDTPVKRYSSGMYVRLGFAVAAHIDPRVLLVDEVLAVGDAAFQSKCLQRIESLRRGGMTIVFVSHDMPAIERLCDRVFLLQHGGIRSEGEPRMVIADYYSAVLAQQAPPSDGTAERTALAEAGLGRAAEIVAVRFLDRGGHGVDRLATGDPFTAQIEYRAHRAVEDPVFELLFYSLEDRLYCHYTTALAGEPIPALRDGGVVEIACDELGLAPGIYRVDVSLARSGTQEVYDRQLRRYVLRVLPGRPVRGLFYSPHRWRLLPGARIWGATAQVGGMADR